MFCFILPEQPNKIKLGKAENSLHKKCATLIFISIGEYFVGIFYKYYGIYHFVQMCFISPHSNK